MSKASKGKPKSEITKERMSIAAKNKILSETHKLNISKANTGKKHSEENKKLFSKQRQEYWENNFDKRKNQGKCKRVPIIQYTLEDIYIKEYESITEAIKNTGISEHYIKQALKSLEKIAGGFKWKRKEK